MHKTGIEVRKMDAVYNKMNPWWENRRFDTGIKRAVFDEIISKALKRRQIELISGARRTGKTTLLKQLVSAHLKIYGADSVFYVNLEDPALSGTAIRGHIKNFRAKFGHRQDKKIALFFDEVQESKNWETELKSIYDSEDVKIFVTGSTSHLISLRGGKLTGRQATTILYPLDFSEYVGFKKLTASSAEDYLSEKNLDSFLQEGGYPELVLHDPPDYLQNLVQDVITRDIIRYFKPRKDREVFGLFTLLCAAMGTRVSYSRFKRVLGISVDTVKDYIGYFEMAYMMSVLEKWSDSPNDRIYANKKIYLYDTGFKTVIDPKKDVGVKAENALYIHLRKKGVRMGYFAESSREVDFIIETRGGPLPVESKYTDELEDNDIRLSGLKLYIKKNSPKKAYVITRSVEKDFKIGSTSVAAVPLWKVLSGERGII